MNEKPMAVFPDTEEYGPAFEAKSTPKTSAGLPFPEACARHVEFDFKSRRVYILVSRSLSKQTDALERLRGALQDKVVGVWIGISPHTPICEVVEVLEEVRNLDIDCLISLGAGSITDAAKMVRFAIANGAYTEDEIATLWGGHSYNPIRRRNIKLPEIPLICIPTSLSGGEYQSIAGATETSTTLAKRTFEPRVDPDLVIQDPELSKTTPDWVWLSTGIRAVDHCVETACSLQSAPDGDRAALLGLQRLVPGLLRCKSDPSDIDGRYLCQIGVVRAMQAVSTGVPLGASHAIGHQLGPFGVGHGQTSCILLPAVCKFNASKRANNERQDVVRDVLLDLEPVQAAIREDGRTESEMDLGDILDIIIKKLGMPRSLDAVGIGRDKFDQLAENSLQDLWIKTNAFPITTCEQVLQVLEMVAADK